MWLGQNGYNQCNDDADETFDLKHIDLGAAWTCQLEHGVWKPYFDTAYEAN